MKDLNELRLELNEIDDKIVELLSRRMDICAEIGEYKKNTGKPVLDTKREEEKLDMVAGLVEDDKKSGVKETFRTIMSESRKLQEIIISSENTPTSISGE